MQNLHYTFRVPPASSHTAKGPLQYWLEVRMPDHVTGLQVDPLGGAGQKLQDRRDPCAGLNNSFRMRLRPSFDAMHAPVGKNKYHVERDVCIAHPHGDILGLRVDKQHSLFRRQRPAKHQPACLVRRRSRYLDVEFVRARGRNDHQGIPLCALLGSCGSGAEQDRAGENRTYREYQQSKDIIWGLYRGHGAGGRSGEISYRFREARWTYPA